MTQYINPKLAGRLKDVGLQFLDAAGNIYLKQSGHFLFVTENKDRDLAYEEGKTTPVANALSAKTVVVMYTILKKCDALQWSYRRFLEKTSVSIGMISQ